MFSFSVIILAYFCRINIRRNQFNVRYISAFGCCQHFYVYKVSKLHSFKIFLITFDGISSMLFPHLSQVYHSFFSCFISVLLKFVAITLKIFVSKVCHVFTVCTYANLIIRPIFAVFTISWLSTRHSCK